MEFIGRVSSTSKVQVYKAYRDLKRLDNYHFMPDHVLDLQLSCKDPLMILGFIMRENWGIWNAQTDAWLVQSYTFVREKVTYELTLAKDAYGSKFIYMTVTDRGEWLAVSTIHLASTDYHKYICDGLGNELYDFDKTMYRQSGPIPTKWVHTLEELS